jgi:hypothetical protein
MEAHSSFYQRQVQKLIENGTHWKPLNQIQLELIKSIENITEILEILKDTAEEDTFYADKQTLDTYVYDAYQTTVKLCSCMDSELYIIYMENAAIIRYNMIQLKNFIYGIEMFGEHKNEVLIEQNHLNLLKEEYQEFKSNFVKWAALFEKDEINDDWNLFN